MKLTELNSKPSMMAKKALKENFNVEMNFDSLDKVDTKRLLTKVKGLLGEMRAGTAAHSRESNPSYLKLVFMEQALTHHYGELKAIPAYNPRIVVENEEVEKSQVILAAQEMIDSIQKMVEDISDMLVKELPAVVDGVNSEVGTSEGEQFNSQATEALTALQQALTSAKSGMQGALGTITGQAGPEMNMGEPEMGAELGAEAGAEMGAEELPPEEPAEEPAAAVGRPAR